jgi:hypothetical protein
MNFTFIKNEIENSYISKDSMHFSNTGDGRLDSAESEISIINHLKELFKDTEVIVTEAPKARAWYDILLTYKGQVFPINIKITSGASSDNVSSKKGLFYTLTGLWPDEVSNLNNWTSYNTLLTENFNPDTTADYYFVVYFKEDETFLFTSLKRLNTLVANGNNLPFQCRWSDNCAASTRSSQEQAMYLMNTYITSWLKKTNGFEPLMKWREQQ